MTEHPVPNSKILFTSHGVYKRCTCGGVLSAGTAPNPDDGGKETYCAAHSDPPCSWYCEQPTEQVLASMIFMKDASPEELNGGEVTPA